MIDVSIQHKLGDTYLDVDVSLPSNGITAIFGRSGAGKSSFINLISGLIQPDLGIISIDDRLLFDSRVKVNVPIEKRNVGYVFQDARLFPHYSVKGNLLYGQKKKVNQNNSESYFHHIVELLNLSHLLKRYPVDLSGGEKQRVAIARALLSSPDILLMDEPLASLDLPRKKEVMPFLEKLSKEINIPILYVTHSMSEILRLADHILLLNDGKVDACGTLESVWGSSVMRPWQAFSDQSSLFEAQVVEHHDKYALTKVLLNDEVGIWVQRVNSDIDSEIRLQIRANDVSIALEKPLGSSIRNIISAKVVKVEVHQASHGKQSVGIQLELSAGCLLWATITQWALDDLHLEPGQRVYAQIKGVSVTQRDMALKPLVHT